MLNKCNLKNSIARLEIYSLQAEVPGAARINLRPAEHLLFCKQFSKMCPSAFRVSGPQGVSEQGSKLHKNLLRTGGDMRAKFYQDPFRSFDSHLPSTYQKTHRQINICAAI